MPVLLLILRINMKSGRNLGQHAVLSLFSLLLLCFPIAAVVPTPDSPLQFPPIGTYIRQMEHIARKGVLVEVTRAACACSRTG